MRTPLSAALLVVLAACDAGPIETADAQAVAVRPSLDGDLVFSRSNDAAVETVFVNGSDRTVYFATPSFSTVLERREGDEWVELPAWYVIAAIPPSPSPIAPGMYRPLMEVPLASRSLDVRPGTYRVRVMAYENAERTRLAPEAERVSLPFEVVE